MTKHVRLTIKLGAAIDEWRNSYKVEIAAKIVVIENWWNHVDCTDRACRRYSIGRRDASYRCKARDPCQDNQGRGRYPCRPTHARAGLIRGDFLELFSEGSGEKDRRQQSKKVGVTHL